MSLHKSVEGNDGAAQYQQSHLKETPAAESIGKFQEQNLQQIAQTNTTINRFLSAFIDHVNCQFSLTFAVISSIIYVIFLFKMIKFPFSTP